MFREGPLLYIHVPAKLAHPQVLCSIFFVKLTFSMYRNISTTAIWSCQCVSGLTYEGAQVLPFVFCATVCLLK